MILAFMTAALGFALAAMPGEASQTQQPPAREAQAPKPSPDLGYDDTPFLPDGRWRVHDRNRPHPRIIVPGSESAQNRPGRPPSDAVVLFDGRDLSNWLTRVRGTSEPVPAAWKVKDGYMEVVRGAGSLFTREKFGDCQLHVEWATPKPPTGSGQSRGNSGVLLMSRYEIQVLDSCQSLTYADGQAASIYGQYAPLVNASRGPGQWQTYDIVFEAPRFEGDKLVKPAYATVFHNGVLVHHRQQIIGRMRHKEVGTYAPHEPEEPLMLQNHGNPVRFRNIWIRRLAGYDQP